MAQKKIRPLLSAGTTLRYATVTALVCLLAMALVEERRAARLFASPFEERLPSQLLVSGEELEQLDQRVVLIFQAEDCYGILDESIQTFNEVDARITARVSGLVLGESTSLAAIAADHGISFHLYDADELAIISMLANLGYRQTPVALVVGDDGEVRMVVNSSDFGVFRAWLESDEL